MIAFYIFLASIPVSLLGIIAFVVMIATGVRKGDRNGLTLLPRSRLDRIARRMTGVCVRLDDDSDS